jgi:hypothetical protein
MEGTEIFSEDCPNIVCHGSKPVGTLRLFKDSRSASVSSVSFCLKNTGYQEPFSPQNSESTEGEKRFDPQIFAD